MGGTAFQVDAGPNGLAQIGGSVAFATDIRWLDFSGTHIPFLMQNNLGTITYTQFENYGRNWRSVGADGHSGSNMKIDSGDGGSYIDFKCYAIRVQSYADNSDQFKAGVGGVGFFGHAMAGQPTVTGSKGGNAALASLLTALASFGLLIDSTT